MAAEGPVLIIAGAGTGKTRVIAHRIAALLQTKPDLTPANVLALTFSRKAAQEMLERVEGLLGTYADELGIFTFHSFCHRLLQDHTLECGLPSRFRLLDRTESWIFFKRLLPEFRLARTWSLSDPTDCIEGYLRFIGRAKDELVRPEDYAAMLPKLSDPQEQARAQEIQRAYRIYQEKMREAGNLDFGDLVSETVFLLQKKPSLLKDLRTQYRTLLVDEFQDTNVAQIELLKLLSGGSGNLCVVGDDDQAIYRFRGASFASFLLLKEAFPGVQTIRLTQNYRSTRHILSVADRLIRNNDPDRYDPGKHLWTGNPQGTPIEVLVCRDELHEAQVAFETIRSIEPPARIAVLYRAHAHRNRLTEILKAAGIPFYLQGGSALFDQPEIRDLISFLRILKNPSDSVNLFRVIGHPIWGIPHEDLFTLSRSTKTRGISLYEVLKDASRLPVQKETKTAVKQFLQELSRIGREAARTQVDRLVRHIAEESHLRALFCLRLEEAPSLPLGTSVGRSPGASALRPVRGTDPLFFLGRFLRFTLRYAENHPGSNDLEAFLWYQEAYLQAGGDPAEEESLIGEHRIQLMTIHQAKGLEFDWVILLGMTQGRFPARGRPESIPFPVELMKEPLPKGDYHLQEERRLCYVACTRARKGLFFLTQERVYHRPSPFIREILGDASTQDIRRVEPEMKPPTGSFSAPASLAAEREILQILSRIRSLGTEDRAGFTKAMAQIKKLAGRLRRKREKRELVPPLPLRFAPSPETRYSFSQLETYRYCPMKYLYGYLYQIPVTPTPQMTFGTDLHACMEDFFKQVMENRVPALEELLELFHRLCAKGRYGEPHIDREYQRLGVQILTAFYKKHEGSFSAPLFVEKNFSLRLSDGWIRGVVDRIDPLPQGGVEVIDYKTGKPKEGADSDEQLQLRLYALAVKEALGLEPRRISFYYLRNNEKLSFEQGPKNFEETRRKIQDLIRAIRSGDFSPTPSVVKCRRCDFRNLCPASMV